MVELNVVRLNLRAFQGCPVVLTNQSYSSYVIVNTWFIKYQHIPEVQFGIVSVPEYPDIFMVVPAVFVKIKLKSIGIVLGSACHAKNGFATAAASILKKILIAACPDVHSSFLAYKSVEKIYISRSYVVPLRACSVG
jgi:hypothetical protein